MAFLVRRHPSPSARFTSAYRRCALATAAFALIAAHKPLPRSGELVLDIEHPIVTAIVAGVQLRLRVDLDQRESIELNPRAAALLPLKWEDGEDLDVGRKRLHSRLARAVLVVDRRARPTQVAEHGRDCCLDSDGAIDPDLLPYASVRWRHAGAPVPNGERRFELEQSELVGLSAAEVASGLRLAFAFGQAQTVATAAAGGRLTRLWGGRWADGPIHIVTRFGVSRPARMIGFAHPGTLAGFRVDRLLVRYFDFPGKDPLPSDPVDPSDIVVAKPIASQYTWPAVFLGSDRLSRCAEIIYTAVPRTLTLRCAFDRP